MTGYNPNAIFQLLVLAIFGNFSSSNTIFQPQSCCLSFSSKNVVSAMLKTFFYLNFCCGSKNKVW
jgi:hypothetical protein